MMDWSSLRYQKTSGLPDTLFEASSPPFLRDPVKGDSHMEQGSAWLAKVVRVSNHGLRWAWSFVHGVLWVAMYCGGTH